MSKSNKLKTVKLKRDTWEAVKILQIKLDLSSIDETVKFLIKYYYEKEKGGSE